MNMNWPDLPDPTEPGYSDAPKTKSIWFNSGVAALVFGLVGLPIGFLGAMGKTLGGGFAFFNLGGILMSIAVVLAVKAIIGGKVGRTPAIFILVLTIYPVIYFLTQVPFESTYQPYS